MTVYPAEFAEAAPKGFELLRVHGRFAPRASVRQITKQAPRVLLRILARLARQETGAHCFAH
jgi:hypothetical protein